MLPTGHSHNRIRSPARKSTGSRMELSLSFAAILLLSLVVTICCPRKFGWLDFFRILILCFGLKF